MSITSNIANVASALTNASLVNNLNADLLDGQTGTYFSDASNVALTLAQSAFDAANNVAPQVQPAFNVANTASANTVYLQGALNQANSDIVTANTKLKSYVDTQDLYLNGALNSANVLINYTLGVDSTQNNRISTAESNTIYLQGALTQTNSDIVTANTKLKSYVDNNFFLKSGGIITGNVNMGGSLQIDGNLTVSGVVTTINANNLSIVDNMIYLNRDANVANPDMGFAGAYNDGTYHHAGFFRDATDGVWKIFDNYQPEPDASPWIDTSNATFRIASFQANTVTANLFSGSGASLTSISNASLVNNSITINGTSISLGGSGSIVAGATITDDNTTNAKRYLMLGTSTSGSYTVANTSSSKLSFNPSTGDLTANAHVATSGMLVHSNIILADYTLDANNNAVSAGPIGVANGVVVTVSSGSVWTIV